jgi:hypothetical protein
MRDDSEHVTALIKELLILNRADRAPTIRPQSEKEIEWRKTKRTTVRQELVKASDLRDKHDVSAVISPEDMQQVLLDTLPPQMLCGKFQQTGRQFKPASGPTLQRMNTEKQYLNKCQGPALSASLAVRENAISTVTDIRQVGTRRFFVRSSTTERNRTSRSAPFSASGVEPADAIELRNLATA